MSQCLSINQVTKRAVFPQIQYIDKVIAAVPALIQRQVPLPSLTQLTKHDEIPQTQYTNKVVAVLIAIQRQVPQSQLVRKTGEAPLAQFIGNSSDVPLISQINQVTKHAEISQIYYISTQTQYINHAAAVLVVIQRQVSQIQLVLKTESPAGAAHRIPAVDEPVPPFQEEIDEMIKLFPVERIPERNDDHIVDVPVPQTSEEVAEVVKAVKKSPTEAYFRED